MVEVHRSTHHSARRIGIGLAVIGWMSSIALPLYSQTRLGPSSLTRAALTLEDRIHYQRAIEEVYWRHRIWPKQNAAPKPALDEVMPLPKLRAKVEDYLRQSQALELYWRRPITGQQLQAEMDRMARQTKQPAVMNELWAALGNDPYVIAECLARPVLANTLIRNWYAQDEGFHGELKAEAGAELSGYVKVATAQRKRQPFDAWWKAHAGALDASSRADSVSVGELLARFLPNASNGAPVSRAFGGSGVGGHERDATYRYGLPAITSVSDTCVDDTWKPTLALSSRSGHTAVWTGSEMIVWGSDWLHTGVRYNPATDSWTPTAAINAPSGRGLHTAVWTGSEMIVWGDTLAVRSTPAGATIP